MSFGTRELSLVENLAYVTFRACELILVEMLPEWPLESEKLVLVDLGNKYTWIDTSRVNFYGVDICYRQAWQAVNQANNQTRRHSDRRSISKSCSQLGSQAVN